ncbi:hypothetical protein AB0J90_11700 [Micromonospora sp. NPDC049523]|uniref:hypothetical protein n=1 Tax=Micromonospora sp. NPDC049523 TaxID=3155921 RepID=UPI00343ADD8A
MTTKRMRDLGQIAIPGAGIGASAGLAALGLALIVGQPIGWAVATGVALGLPLALIGGGFGALLGAGIITPGVFAPAGLYWFVGFPVARLVHEVLAGLLIAGRPALPPDVLGFLAYQAMISLGFAIGFSWLHERFAPGWLRRIQPDNPPAERLYGFYVQHAQAQWQARENRRRNRGAGQGLGRLIRPRTGGRA